MKKLIKSLTLGLISVGAVIIISGCGGGGGSSSSTSGDITHNGVTYKTVTSPATGKVWLDRNIGAAQVCTVYNDVACYGDYFQWGRNADGHEDSNSGVTTTQATSVDNVGHSLYIKLPDWASNIDPSGTQRAVNWSKTDGSFICPTGFRVPTMAELQAEVSGNNIHNRDDAFNSFLKLPSAGGRSYLGVMYKVGVEGYYWSSTVIGSSSNHGLITVAHAIGGHTFRGMGFSVRCIKN